MKLFKRVEADEFVPRYLQIRNEILRRIESGELETGDRIPSLREVCAEFSVSSITARRALLDLLNDGVVERRGGLGAFVTGARHRARVFVMLIGYSEESWRLRSGHIGQLVGGITTAAWEREATLTVVPASDPTKAAEVLVHLLRDGRVDGLLLRSSEELDPEILAIVGKHDIPTVLIKRTSADGTISSVMPDARRAGEISVERLLNAGHVQIALVAATASTDTYHEHRRGFEEAMRKAGIEVRPEFMQPIGVGLPSNARAATRRLLGGPDRPTAIVTNSDFAALGVYEAAADFGLDVPRQLSVVSFDDVEFAEHLSPPLTTVRLSYYDLGRVGAQQLFSTLEEGAGPTMKIVPVLLVERSSIAAPQG